MRTPGLADILCTLAARPAQTPILLPLSSHTSHSPTHSSYVSAVRHGSIPESFYGNYPPYSDKILPSEALPFPPA